MAPPRVSETTIEDRPRERLFALGASALTAAELLAILIGAGTARGDALELATRLLAEAGGTLRHLARRPAAALAGGFGIGAAKAARIAAALELGRRLARDDPARLEALRAPADAYYLCAPRLRDLVVEEFHLLALDVQHRLLRDVLITRGTLTGSLVHPREVFRAAIAEAAAGVIVVHNHPSGDPTPSAEDRAVTRQLVEAGRLLDVPVYDHVIVGSERYFSFAEAGWL
ncbi:MAG: DNA repair protein RadC [Gemmatimonadetes bacterium]|nr:DNA repair protein RadC [Gemmatimonadota bacterium]